MLVSMTGFGQGEASTKGSRVAVEIRTVNHRFLDFSIKMPQALSNREREIKEIIKEKITRGRVTVSLTAESETPDYDVRVNVPLMQQYMTQLKGFASDHGLPSDVDINTLAMLPEVFIRHERANSSEALWPLVKRSVKQALTACVKMRHEEGKALEADIRARVNTIAKVLKSVERMAPSVTARHTKSFKERIGKMMEGARIDNDRWVTEVAILADRLDFTEEITRLHSHIAQIKKCLDQGGAVSKKLTYLLQEVHREATTIGSKASDSEIIECIVEIKEESEKLREQVQNIE